MDHSVIAALHIADMLERLLAPGSRTVLLSSCPSERTYSGSVSGPTKHSTAETLEGCIEGLTDHPRMKICLREDCAKKGQPQSLWCFGPKDSRDGHDSVCKACESNRIKKLAKKRKKPRENEQEGNPCLPTKSP